MDKKIEKPKWTKLKIIRLVGLLFFITLVFYGFKYMNTKTYIVNANKITTKTVIEDDFQDMIMVNGDVEPIGLVFVNTIEGGTVDQIFSEDGVYVEAGTPLVKLSNPSVTLSYMNQETAIIEQINNLRNLKLSLEKDQRDLSESLMDSENRLSDEKRAFKIDSVLYTKKVIAANDYDNREANFKYLKSKRDFMNSNVVKSKSDNNIQIQQINRSINLMQRNLEMIHSNIENMLVKAPVSGMLSSFDPVIGESLSANQTVAKIDLQTGFKVKALVDEYYLSMVKPNQLARFYLDGQLINLKIKKVLPEVINRQFEIELIFIDEVPQTVTLGQSLQVRLELSKAKKSIMIPRGNYYQSSGGQYVFVLDNEGLAHKRTIKLGNQNPSHYQVLQGLHPGETIITSSYDAFKNFESIKIK
ncbi:MAG: hypothetical protein BM564_12360 [Bacteroidetes bacterium MedPE-SWsnd-G2]|nr:MAG: hypothetical protein BM564_12360 [Bacteroidetes bacterium MedPE-SWsnd-G2]